MALKIMTVLGLLLIKIALMSAFFSLILSMLLQFLFQWWPLK